MKKKRTLYDGGAGFCGGGFVFCGQRLGTGRQGHGQEPGGFEGRGGHRLGDGGRIFGVLDARGLCHARIRALPREEYRRHPLQEFWRCRRLLTGVLDVGLRPHVRRRRPHPRGQWFFAVGGGQQPGHGRPLQGRFLLSRLDGRAAIREVFLSARVRGDGGDHRLGVRGRAHQVLLVHALQFCARRRHLPHRGPLDLGRRLAGRNGLSRLRRLDRGPLRGRLGGTRRNHRPRPPSREICT